MGVAEAVGVLSGETGGVSVGVGGMGVGETGVGETGVGALRVGNARVGSVVKVAMDGTVGWPPRGVGEAGDAAPTGADVGATETGTVGRIGAAVTVTVAPPLGVPNGARRTSTSGVARKVVGAGRKVAAPGAWPRLTSV